MVARIRKKNFKNTQQKRTALFSKNPVIRGYEV